ncbi:sigma-70 family RNA polymerase sigma factor [Haloechinothrix salitolerans]|uniref:Sigma-70 family RNA polymerase sigma factor n=1 Tax=Haloechinothrix salitolerans TaxID=926830 RepID=A0ABW2BVV4_9PSEU
MEDAELARRAVDGDQRAWTEIYDTYADRLHDYCHSILRDRHDAADALHDAFVTAATKIGQLRDPSRLRPWLYSICRTQCLAAIRKRSRERPNEDVAAMTPPVVDRDEYADAELRQLVADASLGLAAKDRAVLDLHLRHGLEGKDLAIALGVTPHHATVLLGRVRGHVERSLAALLVGRTGRRDCPELDALLGDWDGSLSPLIRKRVARHIDACTTCGRRRERMVSPLALLGSLPMIPAPDDVRERTLDDIALASARRPMGSRAPGGTRALGLAAGFAALLLIGGAVVALQSPSRIPGDATGALAGPQTTSTPRTEVTPETTTTPEEPAPVTVTTTTTTTTPPASPPTSEPGAGTAATPAKGSDTTSPRVFDLRTDRQGIGPRDSTCETTVARARVVDDGAEGAGDSTADPAETTSSEPVAVDVTLFWQHADGGVHEVAMVLESGDEYAAEIGPPDGGGDVVWWVVASDAAGNTTRSADEQLAVYTVCLR